MKNQTTKRTREEILAKLYQYLRIEDEAAPLCDEALKLYREIEAALVDAIRETYEPRIEADRAKKAGAEIKEDR